MPDLLEQLQELKELQRRGSLSSEQFESVRARLLSENPEEMLSPKQELEIELAALDRTWIARQGEFKVNWGFFWRIPEKNEGTQKAKLFLILGALITTVSTLIALGVALSGGELVIWIPPFFAVAWTRYWFGFYKRWDRIADSYERAESQYQDERAVLETKIRALGWK